MLTPFVDLPAGRVEGLSSGRQEERLATEEERKAGIASPEVLNQSAAELQWRCRKDRRQATGSTGSG